MTVNFEMINAIVYEETIQSVEFPINDSLTLYKRNKVEYKF